MDNEAFDKVVRQALEGYTDHTPAAVGWNRMRTPLARPSVIRKWLWASGIFNAILLVIIPLFFWRLSDLNDRVHEIEQTSRQIVPTAPDDPSQTIYLLDTVYKVITVERIVPQPEAASDLYASARKTQDLIYGQPSRWETYLVSSIGGIWGPPLKEIPTIYFDDTGDLNVLTPVKPAGRKKHKPVNYGALAEIEKARFGKGVDWEYGLEIQPTVLIGKEHYLGVGVGSTPFVNMWINPFWSIQSGLSISHETWRSNDLTTISSQWDQHSGSQAPPGTLTDHKESVWTAGIPTVLRYHIIYSDYVKWSVGLGLVNQISLDRTSAFSLLQQEEPHDGELHEEEYYKINRTFDQKGFNYLNTKIHGELTYRKQIGQSPLYWSTGIFYEYSLKDPLQVGQAHQFGLNLRFSHSQE